MDPPGLVRGIGSDRGGMQNNHRAKTQTIGDAVDSQGSQRDYRSTWLSDQRPMGRILGKSVGGVKNLNFYDSHPGPLWGLPFLMPEVTLKAMKNLFFILILFFSVNAWADEVTHQLGNSGY